MFEATKQEIKMKEEILDVIEKNKENVTNYVKYHQNAINALYNSTLTYLKMIIENSPDKEGTIEYSKCYIEDGFKEMINIIDRR